MASFRRVSIETVRAGSVFKAPITDPDNPQIKLLSAGIEVTTSFLDKLHARGITEVAIGTRDLAMLESFKPQGRAKNVPPSPTYVRSFRVNDHTCEIDQWIKERKSLDVVPMTEPVSLSIHRPKDCAYEDGLEQQWSRDHDLQVESLRELFDDSCNGKPGSAELLRQQCETILSRLERDADALVCLAGSPYSSEYPSRHAVHLASMAMAVGVELGLDHPNLIELGIGCLIHDVGMQQVGLEWFDSKTTISTRTVEKLADHPVHALQVAATLRDRVPDAAKMIAYQMHERLDGSGYPRGCTTNQIHTLAKIAAVADEFVALVAPRPHRPGIQGYYAIKHILDETKRGKFDPRAVRALLKTTGLFPIGSYIELTNDRVGRVIRTGGELFDKPTIEMWRAGDVGSKPVVVNLQEDDSIQVARTLPRAA